MREIKFRAWNGERMFEPYYFEERDGGRVGYEDWRALEDACGYAVEIMQYTGLKDVNGKEIYEGDIVMSRRDYHDALGFSDGADINYQFAIVEFRDGAFRASEPIYDSAEIQVIDNIYENPGLLEGQ